MSGERDGREGGDDDDAAHRVEGDTPATYQYRYKYLYKYAPQHDDRREHDADAGGGGDRQRGEESHGERGRDDDDHRRGRKSGEHDKSDNDGDDAGEKDGEKSGDGNGDKNDGDRKNGDEKDGDEKDGDEKEGKEPSPEQKKKTRRKHILIFGGIGALFVIAGIVWLLLYLVVFRWRETTDDAYVGGDQVQVASRVSGTVVAILADDTDRVSAGQIIAKLDDTDARVALADAEGRLAEAVRQTRQQIANAATGDANVAARAADYEKARAEYERRRPLAAERAGAREEVDNALLQMRTAKASLDQARRQAIAQHALVDGIDVARAPSVLQARAQYASRWVALARTTVLAPIDGYAGMRQVQVGQTVQPGQRMMTVVPLERAWIDANFKEVQLDHVRLGQPVEATADLYGDDIVFHGSVLGVAPATGGATALLPPQNASGNWIKIVQRVPVRIALDPNELHKYPLRIGLSMYTKVDTHTRDGAVLAAEPRTAPVATTDVYAAETRDADVAADAVIARNLEAPTPVAER